MVCCMKLKPQEKTRQPHGLSRFWMKNLSAAAASAGAGVDHYAGGYRGRGGCSIAFHLGGWLAFDNLAAASSAAVAGGATGAGGRAASIAAATNTTASAATCIGIDCQHTCHCQSECKNFPRFHDILQPVQQGVNQTGPTGTAPAELGRISDKLRMASERGKMRSF